MASKMLTIFAYGSLMNEASLKKSLPGAQMVRVDTLSGYRRIFNFRSPDRIDLKSNVHSSVLNLIPDPDCEVVGVVFEVATADAAPLCVREEGYALTDVTLRSGEKAGVYIATGNDPYYFVHNDPTQEEYLQICSTAARSLGREVYENFLHDTFLDQNRTVWEYMHTCSFE